MTAYENLEVQRLQRGIPGKGCIDNALALVGLKDTGKKKAKDFSLGMRQRHISPSPVRIFITNAIRIEVMPECPPELFLRSVAPQAR